MLKFTFNHTILELRQKDIVMIFIGTSRATTHITHNPMYERITAGHVFSDEHLYLMSFPR